MVPSLKYLYIQMGFFLIYLIIMPLSSVTFALSKDYQEKMFISADSSLYNYKTSMTIYEGHVKVDQGTSHLIADRLMTKNNSQHQIQEAIAYGFSELAHYWTLSKIDEPELHAKAKIIKLYPILSNLILEKNVVVTQGENSFQGELILYNSKDGTITVPPSVNGRAVLVYHPDK
jgi:lipopolysaccharide export system protein LptA